MKAIEFRTDRTAYVVEVEKPRAAPGEAVIRVLSAGICGSDLTALRGTHPFRVPPLISGHEAGGIVAEVNGPSRTVSVETRVVVEPQRFCQHCDTCRAGLGHLCRNKIMLGMAEWPGAFAEYVTAPLARLHPIADGVPDGLLALAEPLAVAKHAVGRAPSVRKASVAVLGGGAIGNLIIHSLRQAGAGAIVATDVRQQNRDACLAMGASTAADPVQHGWQERLLAALPGRRVDIVFVAAAVPGILDDAVNLVRPRGAVIQVGLFDDPVSFDVAALQLQEKTLQGSNVYTRKDFLAAVESLELAHPRLKHLVTGTADLHGASAHLTAKAGGAHDNIIKMIVLPDSTDAPSAAESAFTCGHYSD